MISSKSSDLGDFLAFMSREGLNTTAQRYAIAAAFFEFPGHHSLEEFYQYIASSEPSIGQTTVYRTLKLLCDAGLASEIHFSDGIARYEVAQPEGHHDHFVCLSCGKILEIFDQRIEKLQRELAESHGFALIGHVHNLYGLCADCRSKSADKI
ncbi:MAG: transcriptional repressor [Desulfovibrio sp.]|jgi:Fur family ferric uptake transcriptional regulator|nr:transcriptional repressor [Desulfovibrio sp.]